MRVKGNTMRVNKSTSRFAEISKASIKKDFQPFQKKPVPKRPEVNQEPEENAERRIIYINERGEYARFAKYIVGKLVRLKRKSAFGNSWYCEFIFDDDRKALNRAAGWSDKKTEYLFDGLKFK